MSRTREINYKVSFTGDSKQALQAIQQLKTELASIGNMSVGKNSSQEMKQMVSSAQQLQTHLNRSFDANGNLNLAKFNNSLKTSNTSLAALSTNLLNGGKAGQKAFADLATAVSQAQRPVSSLHGVVGELWYTFKNTIKWGLASSAFNNLTSSLSKAIGYSKQLNTSLNNIRIVTGESAEAMEKFSIYANNTAKALKTTTTEVSDAALIYYQQGDTESVVKQKTEITTKAANVSPDSDAAQMSEYLTAVWNGYQAVEGEYEDYVDKLAAVGAATASSLEEVATGMTKVASTANTVGVDFDQLNAILSTVGSVTREAPETTGTAFKTIFARMEDLKMGETLEDGVTLGSVSKILDKVNISIFDTEGNLRDLGGVLEELMQNWNEWDRSTKVAVAEQLAGKRQYTQLFALLENQDMYYDALKTSQEAEGALQEMQDIYAESWVASNEKLKASIEDVYNDLINSDFAIGFVDTLSTIVNLIDEIVEGVGGAGAVFSGLGAILTKVFSTQIVNSMQQAAYTFSTITGRAQAQHTEVQKTAGNLAIRSDKVGPTVTMQMQQSQELNQLAEVREKIEKSITAEDARQLDLAVNDLKIHQQSTLKEQEQLEILQKQTKELEKQNKRNKNEIGSTLYGTYTTNKKRYQNIQTLKELIDPKIGQQSFSVQSIQNYYKEIQKYNKGNYINNFKFYKDLQAINNELKRTGTLSSDLEQRFKAIFTGNTIGNVKGRLTTISDKTKETIISLEKGRPILKEIYNTEQQIFNNEQKISTKQDEINQKRQVEKKSLEQLKGVMSNYSIGIAGQVTNLTSGIFSLVSAVESLKNLGSIWSNEDLSIGEKLFQTVSALTSGIMMATMAYNSLKEAKVGDLIVTGRQRIAELKNIALIKLNKINLQEVLISNKRKALSEAMDAEATAKAKIEAEEKAGAVGIETLKNYDAAISNREKARSELFDAFTGKEQATTPAVFGGFGKSILNTVKRFWPILVAFIIAGTVKMLAQLGEKAREEVEKQKQQLEEFQNELESLKNTQTENKEKIDEYESRKSSLTLDELDELKKLKQENNELKKQQELKESLIEQESLLTEKSIYHAQQMEKISAPFIAIVDAIKDDYQILSDSVDTVVDGIEFVADSLQDVLQPLLDIIDTMPFIDEFSEIWDNFSTGIQAAISPLLAIHNLLQEMKELRMELDPEYKAEIEAQEALEAEAKLNTIDSDIKVLEERKVKYTNTDQTDQLLQEAYTERETQRKIAADENYSTLYIAPVLSKDGISTYKDQLAQLVSSGAEITEENLSKNFGTAFTNNLKEALEENNISLQEWSNGLSDYYNDAYSHIEDEFNKQGLEITTEQEQQIKAALSDMTFEQAAYAQQIDLSNQKLEKTNDLTQLIKEQTDLTVEAAKNLSLEDQVNLLQKGLDQAVETGSISTELLKQIQDSNINIDLSGTNIEDIQAITDALSQLSDKQIINDYVFAFATPDQQENIQKTTERIQDLKEQLDKTTDPTARNEIILRIDQAQQKLDDLTNEITSLPGYKDKISLEVAMNDASNSIKELKALSQGIELIGENYTVTYENLEKFREIYPELNTLQNEYTETGIKLNQKQVEYLKESLQEEIDAEGTTAEAKIDYQIKELEAKRDAITTALELFKVEQNGEVTYLGQTAEDKQILEAGLTAAIEIENQNRATDTTDTFTYITDEAGKFVTAIAGSSVLGRLVKGFKVAAEKIAGFFTSLFSYIADGLSNASEGQETSGSLVLDDSWDDWDDKSGPNPSASGNSSSYTPGNQKQSKNKNSQDALKQAQALIDSNDPQKMYDALQNSLQQANLDISELYKLKDQLAQIKNTNLDKLKKAGEDKSSSGKDSKDKEEELVDILEDQIERYHEVNKQIEYQEQVLKRLQNARDKVYGQKYLDALNKEIDGQQEYIGLLQDRMVLYSAMLQSDREAAAALGATFDENGLIANYTSLTEAKLSEIQAQQKGMTDSEKKEQLDQEYEDFKAVLDQYEETFELMNDATTELEDAFTELNDLIADYVKTQIEAIETVQDKLDTINNIEERFYDNWDKMGERSALYNKQLQQTYDTADQWIAEIGQIEEMYKNGLLTQKAYAEAIGDAEEGLAASINTMFDLQEKMAKMVEETVNEVTARMDQYMAIYEDASKELQFYIDAFTKIYSRSSHAMAAELYNNQADVLQQQIKAEEMYMKTLQENQKQWEKYSDEWFQYEEGIREAKDKIISLTTDTLDALSNAYKEQIQAGIQAFNTAIGVTDFDRLTDNFGKLQEESNRFLDYADKLYETTSLQQKINESINKQDSTAGKARLNNLLDELNALSDKAEVSQYEIDYLQKKYELTLKQNALDEANSQKTLRLMRNDQGDMVYSFVADTEKVTSAKQEYETAMNDLRELSEQYVSETSNNLLQYIKDYEDALLNLDETTFESRQEYEEAVNEIVEYYSQLIYDTKEQLNIGEQNLAQDTYDQIVALRGDSTELTIALAQRESDTILGIKNEENDRILANYDEQSTRAREANEKMVNITQDMRDKLGNSYDEIRGKIAETAADAVTAFETWHEKALKVATTTAETLNPELKDSLQTLKDAEGASDKLSQALVDLVGNNLEGLTDLEGVFTSISSTLGTMFETINTNQKAFSEMFDNTAIQAYYDALQGIVNTDLQNNWGYQGGWSNDEMALMKEAAKSGQYTDTGLKAYLTYHNSLRNQKLDATPSLQSKYRKYEGKEGFEELLKDLGLERLIESMSTGGYTAEGGLALLHDKELVLNATDTENILAAAMILQGKGEAAAAAGINSGLSRAAASFTGSANNVDQSTNTFYVDFPNATSSSEIEIALTNLMNHADQYKFTS